MSSKPRHPCEDGSCGSALSSREAVRCVRPVPQQLADALPLDQKIATNARYLREIMSTSMTYHSNQFQRFAVWPGIAFKSRSRPDRGRKARRCLT